MGIAIGLIVLMAAVSVTSMFMVSRGGKQLEQLTDAYVPAYGNLARANVYSLERALSLRLMIIDKLQFASDEARYARHRSVFEDKDTAFDREIAAARQRIHALLEQSSDVEASVALARLQGRIDTAVDSQRPRLNAEVARLLPLLDAGNLDPATDILARIDDLRDEFNRRLDEVRVSMLERVRSSGEDTVRNQDQLMVIVAIVTLLAAILGFVFSVLVSSEMTRPVQRLLAGTRNVEAGNLDQLVEVTSRDEIGDLTSAFNRMIEQLRLKERIRETFGKYIDPRVVAGLIDRPELAVADGERRVMTVLFCDMKGFTRGSQQMTPQGLVKVMNRYLTTMSEPIHDHHGIIDKYIGDAIMAYWGPPFTEEASHAQFGCAAALDMIGRVDALRTSLPELLGIRQMPVQFDIRIGIATGEVVVGSIGSPFMMSYTVMGDTVNLASRLESLNRFYGTHLLVSEATIATTSDLEVREIDRVIVAGQTSPQRIYDVMGYRGQLAPDKTALRDNYANGLAAYRAGQWDDAVKWLTAVLADDPTDGPSRVMIERIEALRRSPRAEGWDGVWIFDDK